MYNLILTEQELKALLVLTGNCAGQDGSYGAYYKLYALDEELAASVVEFNVTTEPYGDTITIRLPAGL